MPPADPPLPTPARPGPLRRLARLRRRLVPVRAASGLVLDRAAIRAAARAVPLAGGVVACRTLGRHKLLVDGADLSHTPHLALDGYWEWWTTRFLARTLRPGQSVVDAGAGYGYFTLLAAELVGPAGRVLAFEPQPRAAALLRRSLDLNGVTGRVQLEELALIGPEGARSQRLSTPEGSPMAARLVPAGTGDGATLEVVGARSLDAFAAARPDLVKIDVNGAEEAVWDGMAAMLADRPAMTVLLSFDPAALPAPEPFLRRLAAACPLRRLDAEGEALPVTVPVALAGGAGMLCLRRGA